MSATSPLTSLAAFVGLVVAVYGAILSTFVYRRDRVEVVIKVRKNMRVVVQRVNPFEGQVSIKFTLVTATNKGRRPATIQAFSVRLLDSRTELLPKDVRPRLPHEITEGQSITARVRDDDPQLAYAECYYVWDSVGRQFGFNVVPWYRRLLSVYRRRFCPVTR